jgi:hypothetical protein
MRLSEAKPLVREVSQSSARARIKGPWGPEILEEQITTEEKTYLNILLVHRKVIY